jgi:putative hydroxymethylpyrimidine transport system substrate-binding protein
VTRRPALHGAVVALLAMLALALAACGEKTESTAQPRTEPLTLVLDFFPNADHAGIYAAQARGLFRRQGLDVRIVTPSDPAAPLKLVQADRADLAITYEPELLLARDKGADVVSVAALVQRPLTSIMSVGKGGLTRPAQLRGKHVGTAGIPYQSAYLQTIAKGAGVDPSTIRETNVGFNLVPAMLTRKVDATLGAFWNYEGVQLQRAGKRPHIIRVDEAGVPTYSELVLAARGASLHEGGARIRRFLLALAEGHQLLRRDPAAGVDPLVKANPDLDRGLQVASVRATLPVFFPADRTRPWGWMDFGAWATFGRWMQDQGLLKQPPATARALTTEFLPGEGLQPQDAAPGA